jgi:hypothetical protein
VNDAIIRGARGRCSIDRFTDKAMDPHGASSTAIQGALMKTYRIATIPGDGIGKEVVPAGQEVLQALAATQPAWALPSPVSAGAATGTARTAR